MLVQQFDNGVVSVEALLKHSINNNMSSVPAEMRFILPMISGVGAAAIMKAYNSYRSNKLVDDDGTGVDGWLQHVEASEREIWRETVQEDMYIQQSMMEECKQWVHAPVPDRNGRVRCQRPFSRSYSSHSAKRRKVGEKKTEEKKASDNSTDSSTGSSTGSSGSSTATGSFATTLSNSINSTLQRGGVAQASMTAEELIDTLTASGLANTYREQLVADIKVRTESDPDYLADPTKFPKLQNISGK